MLHIRMDGPLVGSDSDPIASTHMEAAAPAAKRQRQRPLVLNTLLGLPTALLHVVCSFLTVFGIDALSVCNHGLCADCRKPGAWRTVSVPPFAYPLWRRWLRDRINTSASVGQLHAVSMELNRDQWRWFVRHHSLRSLRVSILPGGSLIHGLGRLRNLRVLHIAKDVSILDCEPLPGSLEVLHAYIVGSLDCLTSCTRLRVLDLFDSAPDISLLPRLLSLRELTVSDYLSTQLRHVARCTGLVVLRLGKANRSQLRCLLDLPRDRLRTLNIAFRDCDVGLEVISHFTRLQTASISAMYFPDECLSAIVKRSLIRLNLNLEGTMLSSRPFDARALSACPLLQEFHAGFNRIINVEGLWQCRDLRVLDLRGTLLPSLDDLVLHCPKLQILAIATHCEALSSLRSLKNLRQLNVYTCTDVLKRHLVGFPALLRVNTYSSSSLSNDDLTYLKQSFGLDISHWSDLWYWDESRPLSRSSMKLNTNVSQLA